MFHTNYYAQQKHTTFEPINAATMKTFLAINIAMGIKKLPFYKDYWSANIQLRDNYIASLMPLKKFQWCLSNLHINDNNLEPRRHEQNYDKLYKVRPYLDHLSKTFLQCMNPNEFQSIDESMLKFKGRSTMKQYMPMKPIKRGYKIWVRADQTGFISEFEIYTGKTDSVESSLGKRVILTLTNKIQGKYHRVFLIIFSLLLTSWKICLKIKFMVVEL